MYQLSQSQDEQELWLQHDPAEPLSVRYRLQKLLNQHEHAEVYLGILRTTGMPVAIKVSKERRNYQEMEKFRLHVLMQIQLQHPHLVSVLDFGVQSEQAYLVMPYLAEGSLRQRHPRGSRLPLPTIQTYLAQMSDVLSYLHTLGLVHRDIKPHNFLVQQGDTILLSDLGSAMSLANSTDGPAFFEGTIAYAAPEQIDGQATSASDQYALAITIYEWFTGTWPFVGSFSDVIEQHFNAPPPPLSQHNVRVDTSLEAVIYRALEKDPAARFPTVQAFTDAFQQASIKSVSQAKPTNPLRQFRSPGNFFS